MAEWLNVWRWIAVATALIGSLAACTPPPNSPPPLSEVPAAVATEVSLDLRPKWPRTAFQLEIMKEDTRYVGGSHSSESNRIVADVIIEPVPEGGFSLSWTFGVPDTSRRSGYSRGSLGWERGSGWGLRNTNLRIQFDANGMPETWIQVETSERFPALQTGTARRELVYVSAPHPFLYLALAGSFVSGGAANPFRSSWEGWPSIWEDSLVLIEEFDREQNKATIIVQRMPEPGPLRERIMEQWRKPGASHRYVLRPKDEINRLNFQTRATYRVDLTTGLPEHVVHENIVSLDGKLDRFIRYEFRLIGGK